MSLEDVIKAEDLIFLIVIIFVSFIGSLSKDYLGMFNYSKKMCFSKILFSTFTASIIVFVFAPFIVEYLGFRGLVGASFLGGLVGFETLQRISTLNGLISFLEKIIEMLNIWRSPPPQKPPD